MQAKILQLLFKNSYKTILSDSLNAINCQEFIFQDLLAEGCETAFGKTFNFSSIKSLDDFKNLVPIQNYEDFEPFIQKMIQGEKNVLWPGRMKMFAKSSGTSNAKSKYIPLSKASLSDNHYKGGKNILSIFCHHFPDKNIFEGKNVSVAGSLDKNEYQIKIGDLSALLLSNLPQWVQIKRLPSKKTALMANWEEKIEKVADEIVNEQVASLSGVPSWNLILLEKALSQSKKKSLKELWPDFQLYMHGGVNFAPYKKLFSDLIGTEDFVFLETYNASEGFFAIQDQFDQKENGMLLLCNHAVFYEFLPLGEQDNTFANTLQLDEVQLDVDYALVISTKSGLWRYKIGDTLRFVSLNPYRIVLSGRLKYNINIFGEELMEDNANKAINETCQLLNCHVSEFTVAPIFPNKEGKGGHEWLIEFIKAPNSLDDFAHVLDMQLKAANSDYEAKRTSNLALQLPLTKSLPKGTFYHWLKSKNKLGSQNKVPRLQNNRKVVEEILALIKVH